MYVGVDLINRPGALLYDSGLCLSLLCNLKKVFSFVEGMSRIHDHLGPVVLLDVLKSSPKGLS